MKTYKRNLILSTNLGIKLVLTQIILITLLEEQARRIRAFEFNFGLGYPSYNNSFSSERRLYSSGESWGENC